MALQHITTLVQNIHRDCQCKIWLKALLLDLLMQQLLLKKKTKQTVKLRNQMVPVLTVNRMDGPYMSTHLNTPARKNVHTSLNVEDITGI